ncbi:MAG: XkdF-like putative serine protease domain-containing protein [Desulfomonilaceae bacterium]|nr:XkdF-like putative serine protease domain-containing protein [Desulfomonilaceae bacterium]
MRPGTVIKSEDQRIVYAAVYSPLRVDTDNEAMLPGEIERMAHRFMLKGRWDCIDVNHDRIKSGCLVVESFVAREGDALFVEGEWVLGIKICHDDLWEKVRNGELNGLSFSSRNIPTRTMHLVDLLQPVSGKGTTEVGHGGALPAHSHDISITFAQDSRVIPTVTGQTLGHVHTVSRMTATDPAQGHAHRLVLQVG